MIRYVWPKCIFRTIKNVSYSIAGLSGSFFKIPTNDLVETKMKMFKIVRFPLVYGAIDCTHVRIQSPGGLQNNLKIEKDMKTYQ